MKREDFGRCAAQDSADNGPVRYMNEEHRRMHLTAAMRFLLWVCAQESMKGEAEEREEALEGIPGGVTPQGSAQSKKKKKKESKTARV